VAWLLLPSLPVTDCARACTGGQWYRGRWELALFFRVLKQGCQIEQGRLQTDQRLLQAMALSLILAYGGPCLSRGLLGSSVRTARGAYALHHAAPLPPASDTAAAAGYGPQPRAARWLRSSEARRQAWHQICLAGLPTAPCVHLCGGNASNRQCSLEKCIMVSTWR